MSRNVTHINKSSLWPSIISKCLKGFNDHKISEPLLNILEKTNFWSLPNSGFYSPHWNCSHRAPKACCLMQSSIILWTFPLSFHNILSFFLSLLFVLFFLYTFKGCIPQGRILNHLSFSFSAFPRSSHSFLCFQLSFTW